MGDSRGFAERSSSCLVRQRPALRLLTPVPQFACASIALQTVGMLVDGDDAPGRALARPLDMIEPRDRTGLDREAERPFRLKPQHHGKCSPDGTPMGDGDDIAAT